MAGAMSKRQQARNERMLQDLIRTVPGNDRCADCANKNPAWASWNLGIFLCMRCAALHRKLGTHVSKVKSLSMDSWTGEQVDNMKKVGNVASNAIYNPRNVKPDIPIDVDEVDIAIEKYIRQKYEQRSLSTTITRSNTSAARQSTGSTETGSWNDDPPPLPPKPGKRFGFNLRSSSSALPKTKTDRFTPPLSPAYSGSDRSNDVSSPPKSTKPTQLFGMRITTIENNFEAKLTHLRDMGFRDSAKNTELLKSMNGNLDKTVEALTRLGERVKSASPSPPPALRALTPVSMGSSGVTGIAIEKRRQPAKKAASNPWEAREEPITSVMAQPITEEPPRSRSVPPASTSWNPFVNEQAPPLPDPSLALGFQNLQISQPTAQYNTQYAPHQTSLQTNNNPWQAQQAPQVSQSSASYGAQYQQSSPGVQSSQAGNPFFSAPQPQSYPLNNPWAPQISQQQTSTLQQPSNNPFGIPWQPQNIFQQSTTSSPAPIYGQQSDFFSPPQSIPQQQQQQFQQQSYSGAGQNPWYQQANTQVSGPSQQYAQQQQQQHQMQQYQQFAHPPSMRQDKSSILALYNQPHLAPPRPLQTLPENAMVGTPSSAHNVPQRSVTMPAQSFNGSMNPFMQAPTQSTQSIRHVSNESVDFQGLAGTGRHSPDAFSGLSARYMR